MIQLFLGSPTSTTVLVRSGQRTSISSKTWYSSTTKGIFVIFIGVQKGTSSTMFAFFWVGKAPIHVIVAYRDSPSHARIHGKNWFFESSHLPITLHLNVSADVAVLIRPQCRLIPLQFLLSSPPKRRTSNWAVTGNTHFWSLREVETRTKYDERWYLCAKRRRVQTVLNNVHQVETCWETDNYEFVTVADRGADWSLDRPFVLILKRFPFLGLEFALHFFRLSSKALIRNFQ